MFKEIKNMTLRQRTNLARKLQPILCSNGLQFSAWGMRTISDQAKNVQVKVNKTKKITSVGESGKVSHGLYVCNVYRVNKYNELEKYYGPHLLEYAIASILGEAKRNKKTVIFYANFKSVILKKKIQNVSMIEIIAGKERVWGVVYNN